MGKSIYNVLVVLVAALGSLTYGYTSSILANTLSKPSFYAYMGLEVTGPGASHTQALISAWNLLLYVGGFIGCLSYPWISNHYGRKLPIFIAASTAVIGGALQAGEVHAAMLCVARVVIGLSTGLILSGVPLYQAEVAPPNERGLMVGLHASLLGYGTMLAQWVGVAFFHVEGQAGWRVPFAINCLPPAILMGLIGFLPESPRWLCLKGRHEEAEAVLIKLHKDSNDPSHSFAKREFLIMKGQIDVEAEARMTLREAFASKSMRKRFILGALTMSGTQFSGLIVILTYQQVIYTSLGFTPFLVGVMSGIWCTLNGTGNFIGGLIVDKVGRVRQLICGFIGCFTCLLMETILTAKYGGGENKAANRGAIFFIFAIIVCYTIGVESPAFVYTSEIFPSEWRGLGLSFSMGWLFLLSILFTGVASPAFAHIHWRFYIVFACTSAMMVVLIALFFPETKGYSLEQISARFGDDVVDMDGHLEPAAEFEKWGHNIEEVETRTGSV